MDSSYVIILVAVVGIVVLLLYQVYYYWFGGNKYHTKVKDIPKEIAYYKTQHIKYQQEKKQKLADDLATGRAYILPPKYFAMPDALEVAIVIILVLVILKALIFTGEMFVGYIAGLVQTCDKLYGIDAVLFRDLTFLGLALCYSIYIVQSHIRSFFSKDAVQEDNAPNWFSEKIVYVNKETKADKQNNNWLSDYFFCALFIAYVFIFTDISTVKDNLVNFDITGADAVYHQQCIIKNNDLTD